MSYWQDRGYAFARRVIVSVVGVTLVVLGGVLLVTPGPGLLVLGAGLGVLALEFAWARRWLRRLRERAAEAGRALGIDADDEDGPEGGPDPRNTG